MGSVLLETDGYGTATQRATFERIRELGDRHADAPSGALLTLWWYYLLGAEYQRAYAIIHQVQQQPPGSDELALMLLDALGNTQYFTGEFITSHDTLRDAQQRYAQSPPPPGVSPATWLHLRGQSYDFLAWTEIALGHPERAAVEREGGLALVRSGDYPFAHVSMLTHWLCEFPWLREPERAVPLAKEVIALSEQHNLLFRKAEGQMLLGWAMSELGDTAAGIALLDSGFGLVQRIGFRIGTSWWKWLFACAYRKAGRFQDARRAIDEALRFVAETGERVHEVELRRMQGELWLAPDVRDEAQAERCLRDAIAVASRQAAKWFELRASYSLARLWQSQGKRQEAYDLLAPIYNWFTEGFDTKDLKEAKALLEELAA